MNLLLFLAGVYALTFLLGRLLEKIRIPWVFSALLIGLSLAVYNPFPELTNAPEFLFLANLGMLFLLFIIGFELDVREVVKSSGFIVKTTFVILLTETFFGTLLVHYVFNTPWLIALLVASSFATVGEAMLLPILDEFKLIRTKLGQTILSIGILDDVVEVITVVAATALIGVSAGHANVNIATNTAILGSLFLLTFITAKFRKHLNHFKFKDISALFVVVLFFVFIFAGIGDFVDAASLGALLAGIAIKNLIPDKALNVIDSEIKTLSYAFFAPMFFLWVGLSTDINYVLAFPALVLLVMLMTKTTKIASSYVMARKRLGTKKSILLGVSLSVKFSTSIVIIKLLFEKGIITSNLYSVLVGTTIAFKFVVPFLLAYLITHWKIGFSRLKKETRASH